MKKVYECSLMQVSKGQGFIGNSTGGKRLTDRDLESIYHPGAYCDCQIMKDDGMYFGKIMVTKTSNRYFAKEIRTGKLIPLIRGCRELKYSDNEYLSHFFPFGRIHTYISDIRYKNHYMSGFEHYGLIEVTEFEEVEQYLETNIDKDAYLNKLENFFNIGEQKMLDKCESENNEKHRLKQDSIKIKQLLKKY